MARNGRISALIGKVVTKWTNKLFEVLLGCDLFMITNKLRNTLLISILICSLVTGSLGFNAAVLPREKLTASSSAKISSLRISPLRTSIVTLHSSTSDEDSIAPSPSGINVLPAWQQQAAFVACFGSLGLSTALLKTPFHAIPDVPIIGEYLWHPELLGLIFILAGVSHFFVDEFMDIFPPLGTWGGLWQLPGSAKFHVYWTGVAEAGGGLGLLLSKSVLHSDALFSTFAALLLGLSIAVYPANFYMFTHGAQLPKGVEMDNKSHAGRFVAQIVLCGVLAGMI